MPTSTLFPLDRDPLKPDPNRTGPTVWLRRVVILSKLDSTAVIRDIPFRRGLNIIKTHQMKTQGGPVAGHSVGKTLLMRLIRYTLGEAHFGSEETEQNLSSTSGLKEAQVAAHWTVAGTDWIVVRPLRVDEDNESYAVNSGDWQIAVDAPEQKLPHRDFVQAVSDAVLADLPQFKLPRGRDAKWLDVLAWLSRDYQCGYRKANEWRHEDAQSGPSLDRSENSLVMQWLMGLMSADEVDERLKRSELQKGLADQKRNTDREQKRVETLWEPLRDKLELPADAEAEGEQTSFDSINVAKKVADKVQSLGRLRDERIEASQIAKLQEARNLALKEASNGEGSIRESQAVIKHLEKQIQQYEADPTKPYSRCQADPCWIKERAKQTASDPAADEHLSDLRSQQKDTERKLASETDAQKRLTKMLADTNKAFAKEQQRLAEELAGIDQLIGQWKGMEKEAADFQSLANSAAKASNKLKRAESQVVDSGRTLEELRNKDREKLARVSDAYVQTLKEIFGPEASGGIKVDGNGLHPVPDRKLAPAGAALSVMTTVLAFDVSCLAANVYGLGSHPRFLMHDSPREGDMEGPLFRRLFEIVHELETQFGDPETISFQYIVSTTSEPPSTLADESGPYVRLTLDATDDKGRLLCKTF